jgi:anti-sigma factor RsiW
MTCRELVDFIADYVSGDLSADEGTRFERHLAQCPECVAYLRTYRATIALEKSAFADRDGPPPEEIPESLIRAILAARTRPR